MKEQSPLEEMAFKFLDRNGAPPRVRDMDDMMKKIFSDKDFRDAERKKANEGSPHRKILQLMRDGIKIAFSAAGKNTSNFDDKNLKVMSPKLFSVTDDDNGEEGEDDDPVRFI
uniref:Uncharacterized protein n=1 Tax=Panagrolaimus superbus TaxID=310955 RepID=A0A914YBW5_9BILA